MKLLVRLTFLQRLRGNHGGNCEGGKCEVIDTCCKMMSFQFDNLWTSGNIAYANGNLHKNYI